MAIRLTCPHCGSRNLAQVLHAGRTAYCEACGEQLTIPGSIGAIVIRRLKIIVVVVLCLGLAALLLLPANVPPVEANRRNVCRNNLRLIGWALHNYHEVHKTFPPPFLPDKSGQPALSWRVMLVPFLLQSPYSGEQTVPPPVVSLASLDRATIGKAAQTYACPSAAETKDGAVQRTNYLLLTGPGTIFAAGREPRVAAIVDGTNNTILAVEVHGRGQAWDACQDLDIETFVGMFGPDGTLQQQSPHLGGLHVLMADGAAMFLPLTLDPEKARALATSAGGERIDLEELY